MEAAREGEPRVLQEVGPTAWATVVERADEAELERRVAVGGVEQAGTRPCTRMDRRLREQFCEGRRAKNLCRDKRSLATLRRATGRDMSSHLRTLRPQLFFSAAIDIINSFYLIFVNALSVHSPFETRQISSYFVKMATYDNIFSVFMLLEL